MPDGPLVVQAGDQSFVLHEEFVVGRGEPQPGSRTAYLPLDDSYASPLHARFWCEDGVWHVEDLGSTNGTRVNWALIYGPRQLSRGDKVRIGHTVLTVVPVDGAPVGAPRSGTPSEHMSRILGEWE